MSLDEQQKGRPSTSRTNGNIEAVRQTISMVGLGQVTVKGKTVTNDNFFQLPQLLKSKVKSKRRGELIR